MDNLAPIPTDFTSVVASREFDIIRSGTPDKLIIHIGMPIQDVETVDGYDWRCPVRVIYGDAVRERRACGVDSLQALHLGMQLVQDEVEQIAAEEGSHVNLFGTPL